MAQRPSTYLNWTNGTSPTVIEPPANFLAAGWQPGQAPPAPYMNWLFYETDQWIQYLDQLTATSVPGSSIRLINGGTFAFSAATGVLSWSATANLAIPSIPDSSNAIPAGSVTLADGDVAYLTANTPITAEADGTSGSDTLTNVNFTGNISVGMDVTGPDVPVNTTVIGVGVSTVALSNNLTGNVTDGTFVFSASGPLTVQTSSNLALIPTIDTILLARRAGGVVYLGVNCAQTVLRDGEFKTLNGSGYFSLYPGVAGENLAAGQLVYASPGGSDGGRTLGELYLLDVSAAHQAVRGTYAGVIITSALAGAPVTVLYEGFFKETGLTPGVNYYADPATPGGITDIQPMGAGEKIVGIGFAVSSTALLFAGNGTGGTFLSTFPIFATDPAVNGNGTTTAFTLVSVPFNAGSIFPFIDGVYQDPALWTFSGSQTVTFLTAPATGQQVVFKYILADQSYVAAQSQFLGVSDGITLAYNITGVPINLAATDVYLDGVHTLPSDPNHPWTLTIGPTSATLNFATAPPAAERIAVTYFINAATLGSSAVTGAQNLGSGSGVVGLFESESANILQFKSLRPLAGGVIVDEGDGTIGIGSTGGGGGSDVHGSQATPVSINPVTGLVPTSAMDQFWWIKPSAGTGAVALSGIAAGTIAGQRLTLMGPSISGTAWFTIANNTGTDQNGNFTLDSNQALVYIWNGTNWFLIDNRV